MQRRQEASTLEGDDSACGTCGRPMSSIGTDTTERLEYIPGRFELVQTAVHRYACGTCKDGVVTAPSPDKPIPGGLPAASVLAHLVVAKHEDHIPLYRIHRQLARHGVNIAMSTLADWMARAGLELEPIADRIRRQMLGANVVRVDASGIKVQDRTAPLNIIKGTMWCYIGDDRDVFFHYTPTGEGETGPWTILAGREGYVQADAHSVFDRIFNGRCADAIEVGCMAHARRKLVELATTDLRVAPAVQLITTLYRVEKLGRLRELDPDALQALRQKYSAPTLDRLKRWIAHTAQTEPPGTELSSAVGYFVNHWEALTLFVTDGTLNIDNNALERRFRYPSLGRKNFLFAGSHAGAKRMAIFYSVIHSCLTRGIDPYAYLTDVLQKLAEGWPQSRIDELLPGNWAKTDDE